MTGNDTVSQRRTWFRFFPEGTLEFLVITRVLALLLIVTLAAILPSQLSAALTALFGLLWLDHVLMLWWGVQMVTDLRDLSASPSPGSDARGGKYRVGLTAALPSFFALLIIAPWPNVLIADPTTRASATKILLPVLALLYATTIVLAARALQTVRFGSSLWSLLFLVPGLHWLAMHRLVREWHGRADEHRDEHTGEGAEASSAGIVFADVCWLFTLLPWAVVLSVSWARGQWPDGVGYGLVPICATAWTVLFAVSDLAVLETLQRRFIALIDK